MKIGSQRPGASVSRASRATGAYAAAKSAGIVRGEVADITSIMGIPAHELTPKVRTAIGELMEEVETLRHEVQIQRERADRNEKLADEDSLLPIVNRRAFVRELARNMTFAQRYGTPSSVLYFDVNNMKTVNDTFGHAAGDAVLREVAATLLDNIRHSDVVGRLGGDEFGVILAQADEDVALAKADELVAAIAVRPAIFEEEELPISLAVGHYTFTGDDDVGAALDAADRAMYERKRAEKSRVA